MSGSNVTALDLAWLAHRYRVQEPEPCRVCGAKMISVGSGSRGGWRYVCGSPQAQWMGKDGESRRGAREHSDASEQILYSHGDPHVLALVADTRACRQAAGEQALPELGEMYDPYGSQPPRYRYIGDDQFEYVTGSDEGVKVA